MKTLAFQPLYLLRRLVVSRVPAVPAGAGRPGLWLWRHHIDHLAYKGGVDFAILGPVGVRHDGTELPVGSVRERSVLALLLLDEGRPVPADRLIDELWEDPPRTARGQLHNLVSKLRGRPYGELIVTSAAGYELRLGLHRLDLTEFRRLVAEGKKAGAATASAVLAEALALWRGPALADVSGERATAARLALEEERLLAIEARFDAELSLHRPENVLRELGGPLTEHPYRESLYRYQMLALEAAGRRSDALSTYRGAYRRFVNDLGVEPGPLLNDLHRRLLCGETSSGAPGKVVPRQLPPAGAPLTGRDKLLGEVTGELRRNDRLPAMVLVGPGGVGKTALALTAAHAVADAYPDGQLYADLRGTGDDPADPHAVAGRFLRALGVVGRDVPADAEQRVGLLRSHLAGSRTLLVLDDAAGEAQVRSLLPGTAGLRGDDHLPPPAFGAAGRHDPDGAGARAVRCGRPARCRHRPCAASRRSGSRGIDRGAVRPAAAGRVYRRSPAGGTPGLDHRGVPATADQ